MAIIVTDAAQALGFAVVSLGAYCIVRAIARRNRDERSSHRHLTGLPHYLD